MNALTLNVYRLMSWVYHGLTRQVGLHTTTQTGPIAAFKNLFRQQPPVCEDLVAWCAGRPDCSALQLSEGETIERQLPHTLEPGMHKYFNSRMKVQIRPRYLYTLHDVTLTGANGLVVLPDGQYAAEAIYARSHLIADPDYSAPLKPRSEYKRGEYFTLLGEFSNTANYFHWIHDGVLRFYGVDEQLLRRAFIIVPPELRPYQRETLALLGIRDEQLVTFIPGSAWKLETLYFASLPPSGAESVPAEMWLRDRYFAGANITATGLKRRLYLSRRRDQHGRIDNEDEVIEWLGEYGFESVYLGGISVREQVALFAQAEAIVGGSSAGHINLIFAPKGTRVLEILEETRAGRAGFTIWSMTQALGQELWCLMGESRFNPTNPDRPNVYVRREKLVATLQAMRIEKRT